MKKKIFLMFLFFSVLTFAQSSVIKNGDVYYLANKLIVKTETHVNADAAGKVALPQLLMQSKDEIGVVSAEQKFKIDYAANDMEAELQKIIEIEYASPYDPLYVSRKISKQQGIEWAEPHYVYELQYEVNDPFYSQQWGLDKIQAEAAWDIVKGDPNIVIAINDTGIDWNHPDLEDNIWNNFDEIQGNGIDDDNNGFVDDIRGWDFGGLSGTPDNNPMEDRPDHGTHVAGIASAVTDNYYGVAGISFNCKLMPVKTSQDNIREGNLALISHGYDGIYYAVDNGADIINCSWGGSGFSLTGQAIIDYAVSKGVLIVAAAGNNGSNGVIYPAAYDGVLSVGWSDINDFKSVGSNYGKNLDVMSPGSNIYNTWQDDTYASLGGTSMASPLAAGLAALVKTRFPDYSPAQIAEQIRVNCDDIYSVNQTFLNYLLGKGRINAFKSVNNTNSVSARTTKVEFVDNGDGDGVLEPGENVLINIDFMNYLNATSNLNITLVSKNSATTLGSSSFNAGSIPGGTAFDNSAGQFSFVINSNAPPNTNADFLIMYSDTDHSDFEWISTIINSNYRDQNVNDISLTITSKGNFSFNDYPSNTQGTGFKFKGGENLLYEGGLIYGTGNLHLVSSVRGSDQDYQDNDFNALIPFNLSFPGNVSDQQGFVKLNDDNAGASKLNIETYCHTYSFLDEPFNRFIIFKYVFVNRGPSQIENFYAGQFFDWDVDESNYGNNIAAYDPTDNFAYVYIDGFDPVETHAGSALISDDQHGFYPINNRGDDGGVNVYDGFTDAEKWLTLTNGLNKTSAGPYDISYVSSAGPYTIPAGESIIVAFAVAAGDNLEDIRTSINQARIKYAEIPTDIEEEDFTMPPAEYSLAQNYPNPFNPSTVINYSLAKSGNVQIKLFDALGREIKTLLNKDQNAGSHSIVFNASGIPSGVYFYRLVSNGFVDVKKMILVK